MQNITPSTQRRSPLLFAAVMTVLLAAGAAGNLAAAQAARIRAMPEAARTRVTSPAAQHFAPARGDTWIRNCPGAMPPASAFRQP